MRKSLLLCVFVCVQFTLSSQTSSISQIDSFAQIDTFHYSELYGKQMLILKNLGVENSGSLESNSLSIAQNNNYTNRRAKSNLEIIQLKGSAIADPKIKSFLEKYNFRSQKPCVIIIDDSIIKVYPKRIEE